MCQSLTTNGTSGIRAPRMNDRPASSRGLLVAGRDHACVGHDRDVRELVGGHERLQRRDHREGLGLVALKRLHAEREAACVGEQADGDLRSRRRSLENPGSRNPSPASVSKYSVETSNRTGLAGPDRRARRRPRRAAGAMSERRSGAGAGPGGLLPDPEPGQDQLLEHLTTRVLDEVGVIPGGSPVEPQGPVASGQAVPQVPHP